MIFDFIKKDWQIKALSLLSALVLWCYIGIQNPETQMIFRSIPLQITDSGGRLEELGLSIISGADQRVEVALTGKKTVLTSLSTSDIIAWVDLSTVSHAGEYTLPVQVRLPVDDLLIDRKTPSYVTLRFDKMVSVAVPVQVNVTGKVDPDYITDNWRAEPSTINLTGPENELKYVAYAQADVELDGNKTAVYGDYEYKLYNEAGQTINSRLIQSNTKSISVSIPVLKKKEISLVVEFVNGGEGWDDRLLKYSVSPQSITVAGPDDAVDGLNSLTLGRIDLSKIEKDTTLSYDINLPAGLRNLSNISSAQVSLTIGEAMVTKIISTDELTLTNLADGYSVEVLTTPLQVRVRGSSSKVEQVLPVDLVVTVDVSTVADREGEYELPVTVEISEDKGVGILGDYTVTVRVTKQPDGGETPPPDGGGTTTETTHTTTTTPST